MLVPGTARVMAAMPLPSAAPPLSTMTFGPLRIDYDETVLRPRGWTRSQALWASDLLVRLPRGPVLELCTGAGHIGLLAVHGHDRTLVAVDASPEACAWARSNAAVNGIDVDVREGEMTTVLRDGERFGLILADPPWVPHDDIDRFPEDPTTAIDGGDDGLGVARTCVELIGVHLAEGGAALLQLGSTGQLDGLGPELDEAGLVAGARFVVPDRGLVACLRRPV